MENTAFDPTKLHTFIGINDLKKERDNIDAEDLKTLIKADKTLDKELIDKWMDILNDYSTDM